MATRHRPSERESGVAAHPPVTVGASRERPDSPQERGEDVGLPRLPEPFHRVYSPPEAPRAKTRRSALAGATFVVVAAAALAAIGLVTLGLVTFGRGDVRPKARFTVTHQPAAPRASQQPVQPPTFATIPNACDVLSPDAVRRFVPTRSPQVDRMGTETASVCKYSLSRGRRYRAVQVDARAFLPKYMHDQATSMTIWSYEAQWKQAVKDVTPDTGSLRRIGGLGDAAFERYWIDRDVHVAVGEATVRYRNVVLRMQYTEEQPTAGDRAASERRCLAQAIAAARAGLPAFH